MRDTARLMVVRIGGFVTGFGFNVVLARAVGAEGAGAYYLAFSVLTVASLIARLGMDNPVVRMVAAAEAGASPATAAAVYAEASRLCLAIGAAAAAVLVIAAPMLAEGLLNEPSVTTPLRVMALGLPAWASTSIVGRALVGTGRVTLGVVIEGGALSFVHLLLYSAVGRFHGVAGAAASFGATNAAILLVGLLAWRRAMGPETKVGASHVDRQVIRAELLASSSPLLVVSVLSAMGGFVSLGVLGALGTSADVGIYAVSDRVAKTGAVALLSLDTALAPRFARLYHGGEIRKLRALLRRSVGVLTPIAVMMTAPMILFPSVVLSLFGDEFSDVTVALRLLAVAYGINIATGPVGIVLQMTKQEKALRNLHLVSVGLQIAVAAALIPTFGLLGAATARICATLAVNMLSWLVVKKRLKPGRFA